MQHNVRPERPDDEDAPQLSDAIWELAERCWVKNPKQRPTAGAVCDTISHLFNAATVTPPKPVSSPSCLITPTRSIPQPLTSPTSISQLPDGTSITQPIPNPSLDPILQVKSKFQPHAQVQASSSHPSPLPQNPILHGHTNWVYCATFLPDGKYIVSEIGRASCRERVCAIV